MASNSDDRPGRDMRGYLLELAWAFLLINAIVGLVGWLVGRYLSEPRLGVTIALGGSLAVTTVLGLVLVINALIVAWVSRVREGRERAGFDLTDEDEEPPEAEGSPPPAAPSARADAAAGGDPDHDDVDVLPMDVTDQRTPAAAGRG